MKALYDFIVSPKNNSRYNNVKKVGDKELIVNTEIFNHKHVNREAIVESTPLAYKTPIKIGDTVLVHHNLFRRWHDMKGRERNSRGWYKENKYFAQLDQIYLYKTKDEWKCFNGFCFVQPILNTDKFDVNKEVPLKGVVKYTDGTVDLNEIIGFKPGHEHEFVVDGKKLYRIKSNFITVKYGHKENEKEYNPSWAKSS
jgi:hypothetical protein|tara:strand:- start:8 stop:601 length:594 start_codon:yes stop_codon:yes gene_type:complete